MVLTILSFHFCRVIKCFRSLLHLEDEFFVKLTISQDNFHQIQMFQYAQSLIVLL